MNFSLVLAGHLHEGYVQEVQPQAARPLYLLAAGTATQAVVLTGLERQRLRNRYASLRSQSDKELWKKAALECNEFRTYEFETDNAAPNGVKVAMQCYRYDPNKLSFGQQLIGTYRL